MGCAKSPTNGKRLGWFPSSGGQKAIPPGSPSPIRKGEGHGRAFPLFLGVKVRAEKTLYTERKQNHPLHSSPLGTEQAVKKSQGEHKHDKEDCRDCHSR
jgi:hypothetical protein